MRSTQTADCTPQGSIPALRVCLASVVAGLLLLAAAPARANGIGENGGWQFQTGAEKAARSANLDLVERKKGGYYQSFQTINTTNINRQYNCALSATAAGNGGSNGMSATTSSPGVQNTAATAATSGANTATNGLGSGDAGGLAGASPAGLASTQTNRGAVNAGVSGSTTGATTGAVSAGGGRSDQVLNSEQLNQDSQQLATVNGSAACTGSLN